MSFILASASPRRQQLMHMLGFKNLMVIPTDAEEIPLPKTIGPEDKVCQLAFTKARAAARMGYESCTIVGADTVVSIDGLILGKPRDEKHAAEMLALLSGRWHQVYTGLTVMCGEKFNTRCAVTSVKFSKLTDDDIKAYIRRSRPLDKAGAYGIQDISALFIERIEGDFYNVMGLPIHLLSQMLKDFGIDLLLSEGL